MLWRFLFPVILLCAACSQGGSDKATAVIYLRYDQGEQQLKAEAMFFREEAPGKTRSVVFQSGVSLTGNEMELRTLPGGVDRYELEMPMQFANEIPMQFKDENGDVVKTGLQIPVIEDFTFLPDTLTKEEGFSLKLDATPFEPGEKLILIFTGANNRTETLEVNAPSADDEITFAPGQLSRLAPGRAQVYLVRSGSRSITENGHLLKTQTEYYSKTISIEIK